MNHRTLIFIMIRVFAIFYFLIQTSSAFELLLMNQEFTIQVLRMVVIQIFLTTLPSFFAWFLSDFISKKCFPDENIRLEKENLLDSVLWVGLSYVIFIQAYFLISSLTVGVINGDDIPMKNLGLTVIRMVIAAIFLKYRILIIDFFSGKARPSMEDPSA
ncbi:MAG: hypothetical protein MK193_12255 [Lentisphaeria bacterium]|nr:hypothetical protein [Lentisphaeria bacterium]